MVARRDGDGISLAGILVDTYCVGAKTVLPPTTVDGQHMPFFVQGPARHRHPLMRTLDRSVGAGRYEFLVVADV
ncbi:hypothetical protein KBX37_27935 [Micromonospora sp. U56]|uniref:hypothetical protein n=1 Tax=Micromonospora sp. U56 TaxID=2824900 RepID=UPI001B368D79|nr:hypothetical protein [Micromonospora sp. U56]MBQ0896880.1 hypothetical protein [Micromonospora sp. U56]